MKIQNLAGAELEKIIKKLFLKAGMPLSQASFVASSLVETSLRGVDSHGVRLVPHYLKAILAGRVNPRPQIKFKKTAPGSGILNADHALGMVAGARAIDLGMHLAKKTGIAAIAVKNSSHFGAAAIYALRAARKGFLAWAFTHTESLVVPHGGKRPVLGTNPFCFAAPMAGEEPFCLDMSTANMSWNKLQILKALKLNIPPGFAVDRQGRASTNYNSAEFLTPFGSYKGYGLGLMVEILSSLLSGSPLGPRLVPMVPINKQKRNMGHFFMLVNISAFTPVKKFAARLKLLAQNLRGQKPVRGFKRVLVAGDPEKYAFKLRSKDGIYVPAELLAELEKVAQRLNVRSMALANKSANLPRL